MHKRPRTLLAIATFWIAANVSGQTKILTTTDLSNTLTTQCKALRELNLTEPDLSTVACTAATNPATAPEIAACRAKLVTAIAAAFTTEVDGTLTTQTNDLLKTVEGDSRVVQRLHPVLATRETVLNRSIAEAVEKAVGGLTIAVSGTDSLADRAKAAVKTGLADIMKAVSNGVYDACVENDSTVIEAIVPKTSTAGEAAATNRLLAEQITNEAERQAFAEFTKAEGFTRSVECLWATVTDNGETHAKLTCKPGLLVSGEQVSEIRIHGLPKGEVSVTAISGEQFTEGTKCGTDDLTCDNLVFGKPGKLAPNPIVIAVHTARWFFPTWGKPLGFNLGGAKAVLRPKDGHDRNKLSLVTNGTAPTISVGVISGGQEASAAIPVGFARWKIESGGFLAISKLVDNEVVTEPSTTETGKVLVKSIRRADNLAQDSGIFATFIPQNYQSAGVTLGIATPSNRRPSFYLGPSLRVRTFGDKGLASLSFGIAMRSVLRFPDLTVSDPPKSVATDSAALKGKEQLGIHWFIAINLGFRIGSFGPGETEK